MRVIPLRIDAHNDSLRALDRPSGQHNVPCIKVSYISNLLIFMLANIDIEWKLKSPGDALIASQRCIALDVIVVVRAYSTWKLTDWNIIVFRDASRCGYSPDNQQKLVWIVQDNGGIFSWLSYATQSDKQELWIMPIHTWHAFPLLISMHIQHFLCPSDHQITSPKSTFETSPTIPGSRRSNSPIGTCVANNSEGGHLPTLRVNNQSNNCLHQSQRSTNPLLDFSPSLVTVVSE
ncbi:hypothetical protein TNCV_1414881 [Trichonephila clavipes]|nr:hypothetical protein TNCV_1414881 [Trichonephila clavipes]